MKRVEFPHIGEVRKGRGEMTVSDLTGDEGSPCDDRAEMRRNEVEESCGLTGKIEL